MNDVADVVWEITTNRVNWTSAEVTLKYLDSEIAGISGVKADLGIFTAPPGVVRSLDTSTDDQGRGPERTRGKRVRFFVFRCRE
jgi:hypothetical protein